MYLDTNCFQHQDHIIYKNTLLAIDRWLRGRSDRREKQWLFYSSVAMLMNVWRDITRLAFTVAIAMHGSEWALNHCRRVPPKCLSGRWGSFSDCTSRLHHGDIHGHKLRAVLSSALKVCAAKKSGRQAAVPDVDNILDWLREEDFS